MKKPRKLITYTVVLTITLDREAGFREPSNWDWAELIDPNLAPGLAFDLTGVRKEPEVNPRHADLIADFDFELEAL